MQSSNWFITTFYRFTTIVNPELTKTEWIHQAESLEAVGLLILGQEGFNTTCAFPSAQNRELFKSWVVQKFACPELLFKDSESAVQPFRGFKCKIRPEIVTLGTPELVPDNQNHRHLSPEEWDQALNEAGVAVIDTRNWYEYQIGTFKGAVNPNIDYFTEFPDFMEKQGLKKDQKILIFCTGGVRCERGILELERQGYNNVYQLEGGILNYLKEKPHGSFEGECFVFDERVAVTQDLAPSQRYSLCPHCGQPGDQKIQCVRCDSDAVLCESCRQIPRVQHVCSKNCAHFHELYPFRKGKKQTRSHHPQHLQAARPTK